MPRRRGADGWIVLETALASRREVGREIAGELLTGTCIARTQPKADHSPSRKFAIRRQLPRIPWTPCRDKTWADAGYLAHFFTRANLAPSASEAIIDIISVRAIDISKQKIVIRLMQPLTSSGSAIFILSGETCHQFNVRNPSCPYISLIARSFQDERDISEQCRDAQRTAAESRRLQLERSKPQTDGRGVWQSGEGTGHGKAGDTVYHYHTLCKAKPSP